MSGQTIRLLTNPHVSQTYVKEKQTKGKNITQTVRVTDRIPPDITSMLTFSFTSK